MKPSAQYPHANHRHTPPARTRTKGFTLIELVAVLTVMAVMLTMLATSLMGRLQEATRESDTISISTMTEALRTRILRSQVIPSVTDMPHAIAEELSLPAGRVQNSLAGYSRVFLIDPTLEIGAPTSLVRTLPYHQSVYGSVEPLNPRFIVLSSLGGAIPLSNSVSTATFTSLWENASGTLPAGWTGWKSSSEDLALGRLDFRGLFHRVVFNNLDPANAATYSIGATTNSLTLEVGQRFETWFLSATAINLHFADLNLQAREFLEADTSYVFENGRWSRDITYGIQPPLGPFGQLVDNFLQSQAPEGAQFGATPQAVIEELFSYLYTYGFWASGQPPDILPFETGGSSSEQQIPAFRNLKDCQARLDSYAGNLID